MTTKKRTAPKSATRLNAEILKILSNERDQLLRALGYAGNTADQVKRYHARLDEIDTTTRTLRKGTGT